MDLIDHLKSLSQKIGKVKDTLQTEEATKNALIMPFISAIGYDVFDPTEVTPEYTADIGTKKGEKVDYAIFKNGEPIMFFECKKCGSELDTGHASQLYRYFATNSKIRLAVLTNGIQYHFYSDLEETNIMDKKPFLELNLLDFQEPIVNELKKITKSSFDIENIVNAASEMKYLNETKRILKEQLENPSEEFVKFFATQIYSGVKTQKVLATFTGVVKKSLNQFINEEINSRIQSVLSKDNKQEEEKSQETETSPESRIITTQEELEAYMIVKAILRESSDIARVSYKDNVAYFSMLVDKSTRKQFCRLYFNTRNKYITLFDSQAQKDEKIPIENIDDIYNYADRIKASFDHYADKSIEVEQEQS